jgi:hypothetical protein
VATLCKPAVAVPEHVITFQQTLDLARSLHADHPQLETALRLIRNTGVLTRAVSRRRWCARPRPTGMHVREVRRASVDLRVTKRNPARRCCADAPGRRRNTSPETFSARVHRKFGRAAVRPRRAPSCRCSTSVWWQEEDLDVFVLVARRDQASRPFSSCGPGRPVPHELAGAAAENWVHRSAAGPGVARSCSRANDKPNGRPRSRQRTFT